MRLWIIFLDRFIYFCYARYSKSEIWEDDVVPAGCFLLGFFVKNVDNDYHVYNIFIKTSFIILLICYNDICDMRKANNIIMYWARRN